jgi:hypothetical protein
VKLKTSEKLKIENRKVEKSKFKTVKNKQNRKKVRKLRKVKEN